MQLRIVFSLLFFLVTLPLLAQSPLKQRIDVRVVDQPVRQVLEELEETYDLNFSYSSHFVSLDHKIDLDFSGIPLAKVLEEIGRQTGLEYRQIGNLIVLKESASWRKWREAQQKRKLLQNVRGSIRDADSKEALVGATIQLIGSASAKGTATDENGYFELPDIPVGRHNFEVNYIGYHPMQIRDVLVISGKELVINIELQEQVTELLEVVVFSKVDKMTPLNEMAAVSARSFSVEETSRYAASFLDPARMVRSFAGVGHFNDLENELIVRGNAPTSLLWRLEGIEIRNPNHYGSFGGSGGAISMLSSNTMTNSDFLFGAFPAEYGNSISGVFDLRLRKGNNERQESSLMVGALGLEFSTEGPFKLGGQASYLVNYRYSTVDILDRLGFNPVQTGGVPRYQDLTFKMDFPVKQGRWTVFGIGGQSNIIEEPIFDNQEGNDRSWLEDEHTGLTILGASYFHSFSDKVHLKNIAAANISSYIYDFAVFDSTTRAPWLTEREDYVNKDYRFSTQLNWKMSAKTLFRSGLIYSNYYYDLYYDQKNLRDQYIWDPLHARGNTSSFQTYAQIKYRPNERWILQAGVHQLYYWLNNKSTLEPRFSLSWQVAKDKQLGLGIGKHSSTGHISAYLFDVDPRPNHTFQPFRMAEFPKALHAVLSYDWQVSPNFYLKSEAYFQQIYNVAVSLNPENNWVSIINTMNNYEILDGLIQEDSIAFSGRGRNIGWELTLQKFFTRGHYFMLTTSLYDSRYQTRSGKYFSTRFNGNFLVNLLGGKEFKIKTNNRIGINGKIMAAGGNRTTPVDLDASQERGFTIYDHQRVNTLKLKNYFRFDFSINYTINRPKTTHVFQFEAQNLFNQQNILQEYFDTSSGQIRNQYQTGFLPNLFYRISF